VAQRNDLEFKKRLIEIANRLDAEKAKASQADVPEKQTQRAVRDIMGEIKKELAKKSQKG
jgi:hypothetical protein